MSRGRTSVAISILAVLIFAAGCEPSRPAPRTQASPAVHELAGGCAGTTVTDAEPPLWAQGGWSVPKGSPWPVPWAMGTPGDAVAYLFTTQLVAGPVPRADGSDSKVLWVAHTSSSNFVVQGRPLNRPGSVVSVEGGPSIVDVPTAGCWTFRLLWGPPGNTQSNVVNLEALPAGTVP